MIIKKGIRPWRGMKTLTQEELTKLSFKRDITITANTQSSCNNNR